MSTPSSAPNPAQTPSAAAAAVESAELPAAVLDEEKVLGRVLASLRARIERLAAAGQEKKDYDAELLALRDELAEVRLEDAPALIAQMERLQAVAARRSEVPTMTIDGRSPYFAHMRLKENGRLRDVCIGRGTYLDPDHGVRVVDWRNAPVSRIYYRYAEGDPYEESFGDRDVEGEVVARRDVTILDGKLVRVGAADATYVRGKAGWRTLASRSVRLSGGQGTAVLPGDARGGQKTGALGSGEGEEGVGRRDKFLPDIAALLDPKQFEAIARPSAGIFVVQGGAGSGKTTVGLHRIAYLAFQAPKRFTPDKVIVIVPSKALASYTSRVLPALDVPHVAVTTLAEWQREARLRALPSLPSRITDEAPLATTKLKKHPGLLVALDRKVDGVVAHADHQLRKVCDQVPPELAGPILAAWKLLAANALFARIQGLRKWLQGTLTIPELGKPPPATGARVLVEHTLTRLGRRAKDVVSVWADLLTDRSVIARLVDDTPNGLAPFTKADLEEALRWCTKRCEVVLSRQPSQTEFAGEDERDRAPKDDEDRPRGQLALDFDGRDEGHADVVDAEELAPRKPKKAGDDDHRPAYGDRDEEDDDRHDFAPREGIDGLAVDEEEGLGAALDPEDDALLLRLHQRLRGPLRGKGKSNLLYEHVFVDEVQDCASIDLAVLVDCTTVIDGERSMTLSGDVAQRLTLDVGLGEFAPALRALGLPHVEVEPLQIGYRSTRQVLALAREVLGPLAPPVPPVATRDGAPIERHLFHDAGAAAAFLAGALRDLAAREPLASVCLIARHPWQADVYWDVLSQAEIPNLRRVRVMDFPFKAGVDLTDVRQVKGLEWDYVVLLDVNAATYPAEDDARHLLHIAATRAAHQLWLVSTGAPSPLVSGWDD